tara:strand:+ start:36 stop:1361 length:1326 start_codon:yes stop_codon:yes gene_type:complete
MKNKKDSLVQSYKFLPLSIIICGILGLFYAVLFSPNFLSFFPADNNLSDITLSKLKYSRLHIIVLSIIFLVFGYFTIKYDFFNKLSLNLVSFLIGNIFLFWFLYIIEISLKIIPKLTTEEILKQSIAYEPSSFSTSKFTFNQDIYNNKGELKSKIRSGYRSEYPLSFKKKGQNVIFILGGSFVYDVHAGLGESWPQLIEKNLDKKYNVVNAGVPGHRSFDAIGKIIGEIHLYKPDYILLCNAWNDIKYFSNLNFSDSTLLRMYPGVTKYSHNIRIGFLERFLERFQLYLFLKSLINEGKSSFGLEGKITNPILSNSISEDAIKQYKLNLEIFIEICRTIGATPILMTQPRLVSNTNSDADKNKIQYQYVNLNHDTLVDAFNKCDSIIFEIANSHDVDIIDASKYFTGKPELFTDHVHTTKLGSELIAKKTSHLLEIIFSQK